jgi:pilus assembly protein CpaB
MGKWRPVIFLGLALIIGLIVSILAYNWLQKKAQVGKEAPLVTSPVAVAVTDLPWGAVLTEDKIKMVPFLIANLPPGSFSDPNSLKGRVLISPVKAGEPIFESRLAPRDIKTGGVAAVISPHKRAMAVKVDKVIGVAGFIYPGHRVDVLVTMTAQGSFPTTKTVLENIQVLAVGSEMAEGGTKERPSQVDVITLEVTPEESEKLALAATEGKIQLALRNSMDTEDVLTKGTTASTLLASYYLVGGGETVRTEESKRITGEHRTYVVEVIKGSSVSELKF